MRESQQQSWVIRFPVDFVKHTPYSLFLAGIILWYIYGDRPLIFTAVR